MGFKFLSSSLHSVDISSIVEKDYSKKLSNDNEGSSFDESSFVQKGLYDASKYYIPQSELPVSESSSESSLWKKYGFEKFQYSPENPNEYTPLKPFVISRFSKDFIINERPFYVKVNNEDTLYHIYPLGDSLKWYENDYLKNNKFGTYTASDDYSFYGSYDTVTFNEGYYSRQPGYTWEGMFSSRSSGPQNLLRGITDWSGNWTNASSSSEFDFSTVLGSNDGSKIVHNGSDDAVFSKEINISVSEAGDYCISCYVMATNTNDQKINSLIEYPSISDGTLKTRIYPKGVILNENIATIPTNYVRIASVYSLSAGSHNIQMKLKTSGAHLKVCGWMLTKTSYPVDYDFRDSIGSSSSVNEVRPILIYEDNNFSISDSWTIKYHRYIFNNYYSGQNCEYYDTIMGLKVGYKWDSSRNEIAIVIGDTLLYTEDDFSQDTINDFFNHQELVTIKYNGNGEGTYTVLSDTGKTYSTGISFTPSYILNNLPVRKSPISNNESSVYPIILLGGTYNNGFNLYPGIYRDLMIFNSNPDSVDKYDRYLMSLKKLVPSSGEVDVAYKYFSDSGNVGSYTTNETVVSETGSSNKFFILNSPYIREVFYGVS